MKSAENFSGFVKFEEHVKYLTIHYLRTSIKVENMQKVFENRPTKFLW